MEYFESAGSASVIEDFCNDFNLQYPHMEISLYPFIDPYWTLRWTGATGPRCIPLGPLFDFPWISPQVIPLNIYWTLPLESLRPPLRDLLDLLDLPFMLSDIFGFRILWFYSESYADFSSEWDFWDSQGQYSCISYYFFFFNFT